MTLTDANGRPITLGGKLGSGGEADIYSVTGASDLVAKIYFTPTAERAAKLQAMVATPPHDPTIGQGHVSICWPKALLFNGSRSCAGFLMHRLDFSTNQPVLKLYNPQDRQDVAAGFTWGYLLRIAANMSSVVASIHDGGYVIGDLNESNFLVSTGALVTLVDCDSMQVPMARGGFFRCPVGKPDFTAPELQGRDFSQVDREPAHDNFALGVMIFHLLMEGVHPYAGVWKGSGDPPLLEQRIRTGDCPYANSANVSPMPVAPPIENLPAAVRSLIVRCFGYGHRSPATRPSAREWREVLNALERNLSTCSVSPKHVYANHLSTCPWCERAKALGGWDPYGSAPAQKALKPVPFTPAARKPGPPSTPPVRPAPPSTPRPAPSLPRIPPTPSRPAAREPISIKQLLKSGFLGGLLLTMSSCTLLVATRTPAPVAPFFWIGFLAGVVFRLLARISRPTAIIGTGALVVCSSAMYIAVQAPPAKARVAPIFAVRPNTVPIAPDPGLALDPRWKTFVVDMRMHVFQPQPRGTCWLSPGTVLSRASGGNANSIPVDVKTTKPGDCPVNTRILMSPAVLVRMHAPAPQQPAGTPLPVVVKFEAMPSPTQQCAPTILSWTVSGANGISLEPGFGAVQGPSGTTVIRPVRTTRYTLKAQGGGGSVSRVLTLVVANATQASCPP